MYLEISIARTAILAFQAKLELYTSSLGRQNFYYSANLSCIQQSEESVLDNKLFIYINHSKQRQKGFKSQFKDLSDLEIPERIISSFEVESANLDIFLIKEFIEITFNLEAKSIYTFKGIGYYWMNKKTVAKYPKFCATFEYFTRFSKFVYDGIWI